MRIKNILMASVVAITSISLPTLANAETSYATPQELLIEALEVAVSGVESTTYDEALDYVESLITVNGSEVSYDGDVIGYWDFTNSDTLFADSAFIDKVLSNGGTNIWEFDPEILSPMLTDFNNKLVETVIPTTEDWSKIIGKYDVTLGDYTIPAEQWVPLTICDPYNEPIVSKEYVDLTKVAGINTSSFGWKTDSLITITYAIDTNGKLYLQNDLLMYSGFGTWYCVYVNHIDASKEEEGWATEQPHRGSLPYLKVGITGVNCNAGLRTLVYATNATDSTYNMNYTNYVYAYQESVQDGRLLLVGNPVIERTINEELTQAGIIYLKPEQWGISCDEKDDVKDVFTKFFTQTPQSSKQQIGNTTLKQRLSKFSSLVEGDTIEVTPTAWTIRGLGGDESDFDTFLGSKDIVAPGEETSIPATADIEALAFKVVLPTSLPIYVDELNKVSVATNATIKNESGAAVIVNSVSIEAKPDTGWTLLTSGTPSKARDAKEFTFTTDLAADTVLTVAEERPFRYNAELSPSTEGVEQLDLAEVLVTIDWAEVSP